MIKTTLKIDGMMCGMCESHVNDAIRKAFPAVKKVSRIRRSVSFSSDAFIRMLSFAQQKAGLSPAWR